MNKMKMSKTKCDVCKKKLMQVCIWCLTAKRNEIILVCHHPGYILGEKGVLINHIKNYFGNDSVMKKYMSYDFNFRENRIIDYLNSYAFSY